MKQDHEGRACKLAPPGYRFLVQVTDNAMSREAVLAWARRVFGRQDVVALDGHFPGAWTKQAFSPRGFMVFCKK